MPGGLTAGEPGAVRAAVGYVAGMTDRFACRQAVALLGWDPAKLPEGDRRLTHPGRRRRDVRDGSNAALSRPQPP